MIKIRKKEDEEILKSFRNLFELYSKAAREGKYYIFQEQDILAEKIDLGSRKTAANLEEGLHELGKVIYLFATGVCEDNDPSIRIDGYPKIGSMMWPVLEMMLSKAKAPDISDIESKIGETESGAKKAETIFNETGKVVDGETGEEEKKVAPVRENNTGNVPNNALTCFLFSENCGISAIKGKDHPRRRNAEEDLSVRAPIGGKIFKLISIHGVGIFIERPDGTHVEYYVRGDEYEISEKINEKEIRLHKYQTWDADAYLRDLELFLRTQQRSKEDLYWTYNAGKALVFIEFTDDVKRLSDAGFIDKREKVPVSHLKLISWGLLSGTGKGVSELKEKLSDKRILSVYDESKNGWFLKVY